MATFHRTENGIGYFKITCEELVDYSDNLFPICDNCLESLIGCSEIILIAILNQAYCPQCGKHTLSCCRNYPEDRPIAERRELFYKKYFDIGGDE